MEGDTLLTAPSGLDHETTDRCEVRVRVTDSEGAVFETPFVITVTNVHEPPVTVSLGNDGVAEGMPAGTPVGVLSSHPDPGDLHTYELVEGPGDTGNASFAIVGDTLRTEETRSR